MRPFENRWNLFLDDERLPTYVDPKGSSIWYIARTSEHAKQMVQSYGMPYYISFDHDLGGDDNAMIFLRWLSNDYFNEKQHKLPFYGVHSANPVGAKNIESLMESWKKIYPNCILQLS